MQSVTIDVTEISPPPRDRCDIGNWHDRHSERRTKERERIDQPSRAAARRIGSKLKVACDKSPAGRGDGHKAAALPKRSRRCEFQERVRTSPGVFHDRVCRQHGIERTLVVPKVSRLVKNTCSQSRPNGHAGVFDADALQQSVESLELPTPRVGTDITQYDEAHFPWHNGPGPFQICLCVRCWCRKPRQNRRIVSHSFRFREFFTNICIPHDIAQMIQNKLGVTMDARVARRRFQRAIEQCKNDARKLTFLFCRFDARTRLRSKKKPNKGDTQGTP